MASGISFREKLPEGEVLGDQFGAISQDVSNQGKKDAKHDHFMGLPGCRFATRVRKSATRGNAVSALVAGKTK